MIDSSGTIPEVRRRANDQAASRQALADIVVGLTIQFEGYSARQPGAEALSRGAREANMHGAVGQTLMPVAFGHFARKHAAAGAVGIVDDGLQSYRRAAIECGLRFRDQLAVEDILDLVILRLAFVDRRCPSRPVAW